MNVILDRPTLPVLHTCDVLVAGGSLAGISAALALARQGHKTVLIESRTYLGREITATLRPWIPTTTGARNEFLPLPEILASCVEASGTRAIGNEVPLWPDAVKVRLEDILLEAGVTIIYSSYPIDLCTENGEVRGVVIANKSGRQVIPCYLLLDATSTALIARLMGATFHPSPPRSTYSITLEFDGVAFQEADGVLEGVPELPVPPELEVVGDKAAVHFGYRSGPYAYNYGHVLIECKFELGPAETVNQISQRYLQARTKAIAVASYLLWHDPYFRLAYLGTLSQELYGPYTTPLADPVPQWAERLNVEIELGETAVPLGCFATPVRGVFCLNEAIRADELVRQRVREPIAACHLGERMGSALGREWEQVSARPSTQPITLAAQLPPPASRPTLQVREPHEPQRGRTHEWYPVPPSELPVAADVDVLVVGGGTSGAMAAIAAASEGVRTLVTEMNPGLGGTATYGGVKNYWVGWQQGFSAQSREWVNQVHDQLRYPRTYGIVGGWNIEAKIQALTQKAQEVGAQVLLETLAFGAIVTDNAVRGVVVATPTGPVALLGKVVIDGTGDGDVAAFAGAKFVYGSPRDHAVMWYSLPQIRAPGETNNNFTSMVDVSNILDYNRAILSGRRRGGKLHDHGAYIATRESRHIQGDVVQTLNDQLLRRCWPDVINIAVSNNDIKGQISSDWMRIGLIPPNLEIECPYRILLPEGLENILVVGKAVSVTRDALASIRMQPDLENQGGAAGLAAALAVQMGCRPREVDVRRLQTRLVEIGVLPKRVLNRRLAPRHYEEIQLRELIAKLVADERPFHAYSMMELNEVFRGHIPLVEICCAGPHVVPLLEEALGETEGSAQLRIALALSILGSQSAVPVLIDELQKQLAGDHLPERVSPIKHVDRYAPDQGAMPDAAYLLYALGMPRDRRAIPIWQRVVDLLAHAREEDVWSQAKGVFHYVDAVCYGAERLGDPQVIPLLKQLHSYPPFHHRELLSGFQPDYLLERPAYLEVVIGRALARCGSPDGAIVLINYLNDVRALLAEHAHDELVAISGRDFGKNVAAWKQWLDAERERLVPTPWLVPTDPIASWHEIVLRAEGPDE